ncbi:DsbA family protein [Sinorhizobium mexicanum]|uniref:DsbA family protein n=1 Tax=Sinorhizobium mexicanum TaxID=375549 RepID=A0A859QM15_9HYPH|nr:DsbA family protein [Sinorhizobium mexicanum]MBP1882599.1 protein-disulfide isomerase [Sinorhizobium mexicanum]QLL61236.1 DsbA family protein [Sinorhizobium mexicanum]
MTFKTMIAAGTLLALGASVALPQTAAALDAKQKEEFGAFIKEYLLANPEVMLEVQEALSAKQRAKQQEAAEAAIAANKKAIFQSKYDVTLGNPDGDVTIVEFYDYNCGYCKRALSDMDQILKTDKNVRFVLKELPILGPDSLAAHKVSAAFRLIAPEKYGDFHRALLGGEERATEETAIAVAAKLGVTEEQLRAKMEKEPQDSAVRESYSLANELGITGTPSYVVGNEAVFGAVGADEIATKVENMRSCGKTVC